MTDVTPRLASALSDRYRIERELGQGGMATVYLAADIKHDRKVAIKVLRPELAAVLGAERFVQEIKTTAALSHPHILPLFDSGEADGFLYYVMPYIQGETIREKLNRERQFGIEDAVRITTEVADALDYAHRNGVIHRDIKPENILLHDGRPMVMDFGIALAVSAAAGGRMTETGLSLGTPHYMSPEQATADRDITGRSDIYSLASVLYEMLTGEPPHMGTSAQQIIMKIIAEPVKPATELRKSVPPNVAAALGKALEKLPADRFESAKAFAEALEDPTFTSAPISAGRAAARDVIWRTRLAAVSGLAAVLGVVAAWGWLRTGPPASHDVVRFELPVSLSSDIGLRLAISPDARTIAYVAELENGGEALFVRPLDRLTATLVDTTAYSPVFSPDGSSLAYLKPPGGDLYVASADGGSRRSLQAATGGDYAGGLGWGDDGYLYYQLFTGDGEIVRLPAVGGDAERIVGRDTVGAPFNAPAYPEPLPGGRGLLVTYYRGPGQPSDIAVVDLATKRISYLRKGFHGSYAQGFLFYVTPEGALMAAPFDAQHLETTGPERAPGLTVRVDLQLAAPAEYAVGQDGSLLFLPTSGGGGRSLLAWVARDGTEQVIDADLWRTFSGVSLSPSEDRIAMSIHEAGQSAVWTYSLRDRTLSRLTFDGVQVTRPFWSPDGSAIAYVSDRESREQFRQLWIQPADGSGAPTLLVDAGKRMAQELTWSADGRSIAYREGFDDGQTNRDIWILRAGADTTRRPIVATPANEENPKLSPDGRWLAYISNESGNHEVYVRPFPEGNGRWQVSLDGGREPLWARNGRELFFRDRLNNLVAVPILPGPGFRTGPPTKLFSTAGYFADGHATSYDVSPDGSRFLMIKQPTEETLVVVLNWIEELRKP